MYTYIHTYRTFVGLYKICTFKDVLPTIPHTYIHTYIHTYLIKFIVTTVG